MLSLQRLIIVVAISLLVISDGDELDIEGVDKDIDLFDDFYQDSETPVHNFPRLDSNEEDDMMIVIEALKETKILMTDESYTGDKTLEVIDISVNASTKKTPFGSAYVSKDASQISKDEIFSPETIQSNTFMNSTNSLALNGFELPPINGLHLSDADISIRSNHQEINLLNILQAGIAGSVSTAIALPCINLEASIQFISEQFLSKVGLRLFADHLHINSIKMTLTAAMPAAAVQFSVLEGLTQLLSLTPLVKYPIIIDTLSAMTGFTAGALVRARWLFPFLSPVLVLQKLKVELLLATAATVIFRLQKRVFDGQNKETHLFKILKRGVFGVLSGVGAAGLAIVAGLHSFDKIKEILLKTVPFFTVFYSVYDSLVNKR